MKMLTIGAVSRETGIHPSSLRRYEEKGLIKPHRISVGGTSVRAYSAEQVEYLKHVRRLVHEGFTVRAAFGKAACVSRSAPEPDEFDVFENQSKEGGMSNGEVY